MFKFVSVMATLLCALGILYLFNFRTQSYKLKIQQQAAGHHLDTNDEGAIPARHATGDFKEDSTKSRRNVVTVSHGHFGSSRMVRMPNKLKIQLLEAGNHLNTTEMAILASQPTGNLKQYSTKSRRNAITVSHVCSGSSLMPNKLNIQLQDAGNHLSTTEMAILPKQATENVKKYSTKSRRNIIIVSHGRSGSSLVGDIFNHHPSVFYMYEPLQAPERITKKATNLTKTTYSDLVEEFLRGLFRCKFQHPRILEDIQKYYRKPDHPRISQAIASPPLCPYKLTDPRWDPKLCQPITSESLGSVCKDHYNLTVIKVLMARIPENSIKTILNLCSPLENVDCKVVFLVRDPRAVISSSRSVNFFRETGGTKQGIINYSNKECKQTEDNLEFVKNLPDSLRNRIKLQRFEDLAVNPLKELSGLFEFAGLPVLESVRVWLSKTTHLSRRDCNRMDGVPVTCTKDDAWAAANRWRWRTSRQDIEIIEQYCGNVMRLLGYRPVDRSYELLDNRKVRLFSDKYEAKHWFLH